MNPSNKTSPSGRGRWKRRAAAAAALVYLTAYFRLTSQGRYIVSSFGSGGVHGYHWLPSGFWDEGLNTGSKILNITFAPLYYPDVFLWHTGDRGFSGDYPRERAPRLL